MSRRIWILLATGIPLIALLTLLGWAAAKSGGTASSLGVNNVFGEVGVEAKPAPGFTLETLDGQNIELAQLRGQVVMVDFWASWCPPCRAEAPDLAAVYREYQDRPVEFIGISIWDPKREDTLDYVKEFGITYPNGVDDRGGIAIDYGVRGIPEKYFIDQEGVLRQKFVGPMSAAALRQALDSLLAATSPARNTGP